MELGLRLLAAAILACNSVTTAGGLNGNGPPPEWAPVSQTKDGHCNPISGTFRYHGEAAVRQGAGYPRPLLDAIAFRRIPIRGEPEYVQLRHDVSTGVVLVTIEGRNLSSPVGGASFERRLSCFEGWATFDSQGHGSSDGTSVTYRERRRLAVASDGSLLVHVAYDHKASLASQTGAIWYRFGSK